jgi:secreted PhoX family phosphatase
MYNKTLLKSLVATSVAGLVLSGCTGGNAPAPSSQAHNEVYFKPVAAPTTDAQKKKIMTSEQVVINGGVYNIGWHTIARTGQKLPSLDGKTTEIFGQIKDEMGNPLTHKDGSPFICRTSKDGSGPDHTTLHEKEGNLFAITQFECAPGAIYISKLEETDKGGLKAVATSHVSQAEYKGGWVHCAGMKTPWGSHLGSEEYEPNAKKADKNEYYANFDMYFKNGASQRNPYFWGWTPEVTITDSKGNTEYVKHYSMGRFAHELAYVMPDSKTVYLTDDGTNGALFMFVANEAKDLSAGTLYAAKLKQNSDKNGGEFDVSWINLGNTSNFIIQNFIDNNNPKFEDMFESATPKSGKCPSGFKSINTTFKYECLKVKDGMDIYASRLESRRYAALMGATTEFRKKEGVAFDIKRDKLYVAISRIQYGMEDFKKKGKPESKYDIGGNNDMKLPVNSCGAVYSLDIKKGQKDASKKPQSIDSSYVAVNFKGELLGEMKKYPKGSEFDGNKCSINGIAEPDNLTFIDNSDILIIGEDTGAHQIDYIWAYNVVTKDLTRILTSPYGSETTSPYWYPNIAGKGYLTTVIQHPFGESDEDKADGAKDIESWIGVVGPFPAFK